MTRPRGGPGALRLLACGFIAVALACSPDPGPRPAPGREVSGTASFSHDRLDKVLARRVRGGLVDYEGIGGDADFRSYLDALAAARPDALPAPEDRLAFWINAYNALVIKGVVDHYPIGSVSDVGLAGRLSFFKGLSFVVGGRSLTLDGIEHGVLRTEFRDPRVHFALVCASAGCPELRPEAFHPDRLEAQLEEATRRFIENPATVRLDAPSRTLFLSSIFKWYRDDFERAAGDVTLYVARYLDEPIPDGVRVRYLDYSWALNDLANPPAPGP